MVIFLDMIAEKLGKEKAQEVNSVYVKWNECD
jgi:hypothetical protein